MAVAQRTLLVLADISGYARYVGGTELEHARVAVGALLEVLLRGLAPPLELSAVEGDALFLFDREPEARRDLLPLLEQAHRAFRRAARSIEPCTGCTCSACGSVRDLTVKFILHAGTVGEQSVGGRAQLFGADVVLAHRLLKNTIPAKEYVFVTEAAAMGVPLGEGAVEHAETTDAGTASGRYRILS